MAGDDISFGFHPRASREAEKLPAALDERIRSKVREIVTNQWREITDWDVKPVRNTSHDLYRLRIGGHRVFFAVGANRCVIVHIDGRDGAYDDTAVLDDRAADVF